MIQIVQVQCTTTQHYWLESLPLLLICTSCLHLERHIEQFETPLALPARDPRSPAINL